MSRFVKTDSRGRQFVKFPLFGRRGTGKVYVKNVLYDHKSPFQEILIVETFDRDRVLFLDGTIQCSSKCSWSYDKMALVPMRKTDRRILVLGGGDWQIVIMALELNLAVQVILVELDPEVLNTIARFFEFPLCGSEVIEVVAGDALQYLRRRWRDKDKFDGIVSDLTDIPIGTKGVKQYKEFYTELVPLCREALRPSSWISIQAGPPSVPRGRINSNRFLRRLLSECGFKEVSSSACYVPVYSELWSFVHGWR